MRKKLFLVRHAQPAPAAYTNEFPGPPLGDTGVEQAHRIGQWLSARIVSRIYSSDYLRTQQTIQPLVLQQPKLTMQLIAALRERDARVEAHASLETRVQQWFGREQPHMPDGSVVIAHCGSLNMILSFLDPAQTVLSYPFCSEHGCLTPIAGIWELNLEENILTAGILHQP